jgi:hypothetical protein
MTWLARLMCAVTDHRYVITRSFNPGARQVGCTRCRRLWAMHDETRSFVTWSGEFEQMYRDRGEWR